VEMLFKIRDAAAMVVDATSEYIETFSPKETQNWNPENIEWVPATGPKGVYEISEDVENPDFNAMVKDLEAHNGKLRKDGFFYWSFSNSQKIGRKQVS
jgi:hypothetical protein